MNLEQFELRKKDHIRYALDLDHQAQGQSGLERVHLFHEALPELDFSEVQIQAACLGRLLATPFYVAGMTAGHPEAWPLNERLAKACEARGWAMGVGSQRRDLLEEASSFPAWKKFRSQFSQLTLFANLGLSQLISTPLKRIFQLLEAMEAQALAIHLNALQEVIQPEGTPSFRGGVQALEALIQHCPLPVILKETGCGFSSRTFQTSLSSLRLAAVDLSGLGGTHWGRIEGARAASIRAGRNAETAQTFQNWGESTLDSLLAAQAALKKREERGQGFEIWASGGVRTGLDAARLLAVGAHRVGFAQPALQQALEGEEPLKAWMEKREYELRVALFCTGSSDLSSLRSSEKYRIRGALS